MEVVSKGKLSALARNVASLGRGTAQNLMVSECIEGYALLLENILRLPSEVALPKAVSEIPLNLKEKWQWHFFESVSNSTNLNGTLRSDAFLDKFEELWNQTQLERLTPKVAADDTFIYSIWQDEKYTQMEYAKKRREEERLKKEEDEIKKKRRGRIKKKNGRT